MEIKNCPTSYYITAAEHIVFPPFFGRGSSREKLLGKTGKNITLQGLVPNSGISVQVKMQFLLITEKSYATYLFMVLHSSPSVYLPQCRGGP